MQIYFIRLDIMRLKYDREHPIKVPISLLNIIKLGRHHYQMKHFQTLFSKQLSTLKSV